MIEKAEAAARTARSAKLPAPLAALQVEALGEQVEHFAELGRRVIDQSERRIFRGETVPADEKLYSIFETHTDLIKRGKAHKPVEFGHKVLLVESRIGLITDYRILDGNPIDSDQLVASVDRHLKRFRQAPDVLAGDRGFHDSAGCETVRRRGVKLVAIPQRGGKKTAEQEMLREEPAVQAGAGVSLGHRGAHLGAVSRARHEALSLVGPRALRALHRRRRARQQSDGDRRAAAEASEEGGAAAGGGLSTTPAASSSRRH